MNLKNILSEKAIDLTYIAKKEKDSYLNAEPFPNIVFNDFFNSKYLSSILDDFPDLQKLKRTRNYNSKNEVKLENNKVENIPSSIQDFILFLNSATFVNFLQELTSIKESLIPDPHLDGGGLHEIKKGGKLKIHTDFHLHPTLGFDRRLNVLIYLNKNWEDSYGGHLEFWDSKMKNCEKRVSPTFNKMVIFSTTDFSNHGHPEPLKCPSDLSRKSLALYYFSKGRPKEEVIKTSVKNITQFKSRHGMVDDIEKDKTNFLRKIFRKFIFYEKFKNFEKKYIRTGKSAQKRKNH